ncbi:MAG: chemotaxis protein CheW [Deltaproteobacteria bacterium]|nr:chemotaxis protein CheW [Deltaproteobacteria bacterium]
MNGDKLVIALGAARYALDTSVVAGIVAVDRVPFLPGQSGFVKGIISLRNEPVTVIDLKKVLAPEVPDEGAGPGKVIVVRDKKRLIGLGIGSATVSFMWDEELKDSSPVGEAGRFTSGTIGPENDPVLIIDWTALFAETARILSTEKKGG